MQYARTGEAPQLSGNERFLFPMMRAQIDRDEAAADGISEARSAVAEKGAQAKASKSKQNKQMPDLLSKSSYDKDKGEDSFNTPVRVNVPTFGQVQEVARLNRCPELAKPFFDSYAAAGWRDSEGKSVYSWQQKFQAWKLREEKRRKPQASAAKSLAELAAEMDGEV